MGTCTTGKEARRSSASLRTVAVAMAATISVAAGIAYASPASAADADPAVSVEASSIAGTIEEVAPAFITESTADSTVLSDGTTVTETAGGLVAVSTDASEGVVIESAEGEVVGISVEGMDGVEGEVVDGMTVFDLGTHAVAFQPVEEESGGGVRTLFTLEDETAPTVFEVSFDLPEGGSFVPSEGGSVLALDAAGEVVGSVAAPWARDAAGVAVPTYFEIAGTQLIQHIETNEATAFPVVADPFWIPAWAVVQIIRCGFGGALGWIASAGWAWYWRAISLVGGCLTAMR